VIPKSRREPERILKTINRPNRDTAQVVAFSWIDTKEVRPTESRAYAILNDSEHPISESVLDAMRTVPRHRFVPPALVGKAYEDRPLAIGHGQTISQPYIVAAMSEALQLRGDERVLEIGTGSGYHAAVLAQLAREVFTIEIVSELAREAAGRLRQLGIANVRVRAGDGYRGWPEAAPFDAILLAAAPERIPQPLIDQLKIGGRLVLPLGRENEQTLYRIIKTAEGIRRERLFDVRFVPMTGEAKKR